uniref:cell division cycle-associated protein 2 isoform X2 n=1 Tax=Pristiophorus japonicus TaxID=55135 RepID=UPI00398E8ECD
MAACALKVCVTVISNNQSYAAPALLNENSVSDGNLGKELDIITVFNDSVRFENQKSENFSSASVKHTATQEDRVPQENLHKKARRSRRNAPGKRKSGAAPLHEITISSVENLDRSTEELSCRQPSQANNRLCLSLTSEKKKTLKLNKLVKCRSRTQQMSINQEGSDEISKSTEVDKPSTASLELDLQSNDRIPIDRLPWKPVALKSKESTVQTVGSDDEGRTSFPTTPADCATGSKLVCENIAHKQEDCSMKVDKEQSNTVFLFTAKTPSPPLDFSMSPANQQGVTEEMFNLKSAEKFSADRKRFSRRASSVGARGSPETNSLICYIAKQRMQPQESQKVSMLKSKMAAFINAFQVSEQDDRKTSTPELLQLSDSQQTGTTPAAQHDCILSPSCSKPSLRKKVTFGGELSPELFDKRLPSNTPLRKGETPVHQKIVFNDSPPSALKQGSKVQLYLEDKMTTSNDLDYNDSSPVNDHGTNTSLKLLRKLADNLENGAAVDEERCCPIPINFELSPLSECAFGSNLQKNDNINDEYPCAVLEMKVEELKGGLLDTVSPLAVHGKRSEAGEDGVTCGNVLTPEKTNFISKKLKSSRIRIEPDQCFATISNLKSSKIKAASIVESNMQHTTCILEENSKTGDGFLDQEIADLSISDRAQASSCTGDAGPSIQNLPDEQRGETEDKTACYESLTTEVSPKPTTKAKKKVKTRNRDQESKKVEPRRSTRTKSNVNISKNSTTVTKGKGRQNKFKKELYGKREYVSKKPLLSPIAEVLEIWSESVDSPDCDVMPECEPSRRTSLIYLEGIDIGGEISQSISESECSADGCAAAYIVTKSVGKKVRRPGRLRKSRMPNFEEEQSIQSSVESETRKGTVRNVRDHQYVPTKLHKNFSYCLISGSDQSSNASCENAEDRVCDMEVLEGSIGENVATDHNKPTVMRRKSSMKIEGKHLSEELRNSQQRITGVQILFEGQCATGTGLEECIQEKTGDCNFCSPLESESNVLEDINHQKLQTKPNEMEELTLVSKYTVTEESQVIPNESLRADAAIPEENEVCISPPDIREVFRGRPSRRVSKLFSLEELVGEKQPEQAAVLKVGGQHMVDTSGENGVKGAQVTQRKKRRERFSYKIIKPIFPSHENCVGENGETQAITSYETLLDNFGHRCSLEQMTTNIFEAADQFETGIKYSDSGLENSILKKVRRSARLSGFVNMEGLNWIEKSSPPQSEKKNKSCRRRSVRHTDTAEQLSSTEEFESKTASQRRIGILRRKSLSCNRNIVIELEEPPQKNIILD